jgi:hypothetical protein
MNLRDMCMPAAVLCISFLALSTVSLTAEEGLHLFDQAAVSQNEAFSIENELVSAKLLVTDTTRRLTVTDRRNGSKCEIEAPFRILLKDGTILDVSSMKLIGKPTATRVTPTSKASRFSETIPGEAVRVGFENADHTVRVDWSILLLEGSNYIRQVVTIAAEGDIDAPISRVELINLNLTGAKVAGSVAGSPIVAGNLFAGFEHPLSHSKVTGDRATAWIERELPLRAGQSVIYSSVIGFVGTFSTTLNANGLIPIGHFFTTTAGTISVTLRPTPRLMP